MQYRNNLSCERGALNNVEFERINIFYKFSRHDLASIEFNRIFNNNEIFTH